MTTRDAIRTRVTSAMALLLLQGLPRPQARREASKQVAHEMRQERAERARVQPRPVPTGPPTLANAKSSLIARIGRMISNLHHALPLPSAPKFSARAENLRAEDFGHTPKPVTSDPTLVEAFPLVIASTGSAELIPPETYHTSLRWSDRATDGWRSSIEHNARLAEERERRRANRWIG
jgi:hypothetical protein